MAAWLLQGLTPKQLSRPAHKALLEATAADPASLMVCGLMAGELERGLKPGGSKAGAPQSDAALSGAASVSVVIQNGAFHTQNLYGVYGAGKNAFKPLKDLLPGLAAGLDYSTATKGARSTWVLTSS